MKRRALLALLPLAAGCVRAPPDPVRSQEEPVKCELVRTLMREPLPQSYLAQLAAEGQEGLAPVLVFIHRPEEGLLERLFAGEPTCAGEGFRVVQQILKHSVVLYLQPRAEGYAYDVRRSEVEGLALAGTPRGEVRLEDGSWVVSSP
jgi:hypothetical protein